MSRSGDGTSLLSSLSPLQPFGQIRPRGSGHLQRALGAAVGEFALRCLLCFVMCQAKIENIIKVRVSF